MTLLKSWTINKNSHFCVFFSLLFYLRLLRTYVALKFIVNSFLYCNISDLLCSSSEEYPTYFPQESPYHVMQKLNTNVNEIG